jgi:hypothetical protein
MSPAPVAPVVGGRRRRMSKATRRMLRAMKMRGGVEDPVEPVGPVEPVVAPPPPPPPAAQEEQGGRRRRSRRRHSRRRHRSHRYRAGLFA